MPISARLDRTQVSDKTLAGVASGMFIWRRGGVGDLPPLAMGRSARLRIILGKGRPHTQRSGGAAQGG